ncbi:glutamine amidotransferase [Pseudogracilibacillus sp. SE30717A]|uniref:glutamine amidotransferase n=1 Tax=Pseudogracilibacillus sp. SE30717A TaxID=3098293 RepID=UPI00300E14AC
MKILIAGETWIKHIIHVKGFDSFTNSEYGEGIGWFREAMKSGNIDMVHVPSHDVAEKFPSTLEELKQYDAVILSDVGSNTILMNINTFTHSTVQPNRLNLIKEYVEDGGAFAMIGGYMSFQGIDCKGQYKDTAIEEILPVNLMSTDDRSEHPEGVNFEVVQPDHPILKGIPSEWPHFLGYNRLEAKENAEVLAEHNGNAFISVMEYEKGRTLAFASDCAPHWGPKEFVEWEYYNTFWVNVVKWLAKEI